MECDVCDETGLDPEVIDLVKYKAAEKELQNEQKTSWAVMEGRVQIGRKNDNRSIFYKDFLLENDK